MKISNFLLAGLAVFGLASCSNNDSIVEDVNSNKEYDTYLTVSVAGSNLSTRADDPGTIGENTISNLHVYLVKNGTIVTGYTATMGKGNTTVKHAVPMGVYQVVVVANPVEATPRGKGALISSVLEGLSGQADIVGAATDKFIMASVVEPNTPIAKIGTQISITEVNKADTPASAQVVVDRLAAKINILSTENEIINTEGDILNLKDKAGLAFFDTNKPKYTGFLLVNGNMKMNQFQEWMSQGFSNIVVTPQGVETGSMGSLLMTGFYNPFTTYAPVEVERIVTVPANDPASRDSWKITSIKKGSFTTSTVPKVYVTENRPEIQQGSSNTSGMGETTGIVYEVEAGTETFYKVDDKIYTSLSDVQSLPQFAGVTLPTEFGELRAMGIRVYENGKMYYTYFIKDQNNFLKENQDDVTLADAKTYNSVYRNASYNLTLSSISNIGDDVPGGGKVNPLDPNPTIDPTEVYATVKVTVRNWTLNLITIKF